MTFGSRRHFRAFPNRVWNSFRARMIWKTSWRGPASTWRSSAGPIDASRRVPETLRAEGMAVICLHPPGGRLRALLPGRAQPGRDRRGHRPGPSPAASSRRLAMRRRALPPASSAPFAAFVWKPIQRARDVDLVRVAFPSSGRRHPRRCWATSRHSRPPATRPANIPTSS